MKNVLFVCLLMLGLGLVGCGSAFDPCPNGVVCGDGCMPSDASCCPNGNGYCDNGRTCNSRNMCVSGGGAACPDGAVCGDGCMPSGADCCPNGEGYCDNGSTCNSSNMCTGGGGGGGGGGVATNCNCPGSNECSQLVACVQWCTCYYTINGSDGTSGWALVRGNYGDTPSCYMCGQNELTYSCSQSVIDAAAAEAASLIASGQCDYL